MPAPKLVFFKTLWGVFEPSAAGPATKPFRLDSELPSVLKRIKSMGYDGVEAAVALAMQAPGGLPGFVAALAAAQLQWIAMVFSCGAAPTPGNLGLPPSPAAAARGLTAHLPDAPAGTPPAEVLARHVVVWEGQVLEALAAAAAAPGVLRSITSHTGTDFFDGARADALLAHCAAFEAAHVAPAAPGLRINHETHRGRILYTYVPLPLPLRTARARLSAAHVSPEPPARSPHRTSLAHTGPGRRPTFSRATRRSPHAPT